MPIIETSQDTGAGDFFASQWLTEPAGTLGCTMPRTNITTTALGALASATLYACRVVLPSGILCHTVSVLSNTTGESGGSHCWAGLADLDMVLLGVSADNVGGTFFSASTLQAFTLQSPVTTTYSGYYYVVVTVVGTTPTLSGNIPPAGIASVAPVVCGASNTGLTTPLAVGTALTALTPGLIQFYATVS